jgi:hypothetical protein
MQQLKLIVCAALIAIPFVAYAEVDCTPATRWNADHHYKKGDRVWFHDGGNIYGMYSCDKDECYGAQTPSVDKMWKYLGNCEKDPG